MTPRIRLITMTAFAFSLLHCGASVTPIRDGATGTDASSDAAADAVITYDVSNDQYQSSDALFATDATPLPGHCGPIDPMELIAPRVLMEGQTLGLTATSRGMAFSCGATPMLDGRPDALDWSLIACGGCDACDCIDQGYQASTEAPAPVAGDYMLHVGTATRPLLVVPADRCQSMAGWPGGGVIVEIVGPNRSLRQGGAPHLWWAHVTGTEGRCCGEPEVAATVNHVRPVGADLAVSLSECNPDPCACVGGPHPFEAWVDLGDLPPGMHGVEVTGASAITSFEVPASP